MSRKCDYCDAKIEEIEGSVTRAVDQGLEQEIYMRVYGTGDGYHDKDVYCSLDCLKQDN